MDYIVVGINHQTAPVDLREKFSISEGSLTEALKTLMDDHRLREGCILSTCNRVEVYGVHSHADEGVRQIQSFLSHYKHIAPEIMAPHLYHYSAQDAVKHMFRVAASLDSMVVGETQITGQLKKAFDVALENKSSGSFLNQVLSRALYVSKKVRTETTIASRSVSIGSVGVDLAKKIFSDLQSKKVALIGAGEMGELVVTCLKDQGVHDFYLVNRSLEKAQSLVQLYGGQAFSLDQLDDVLAEVDVVITSIAKEVSLLGQAYMKQMMQVRKNRALFMIDLGVPRNIGEEVSELDNVYLYNIDDLKSVAEANISLRRAEATKAEEMVDQEAQEFYSSMVLHRPTISALGKKFEKIRQHELHKTFKKLSHLHQQDKDALEKCTEAIVNKILHDPLIVLRSQSKNKDQTNINHFLRQLFRLDDE